jgi:hypothetical protein
MSTPRRVPALVAVADAAEDGDGAEVGEAAKSRKAVSTWAASSRVGSRTSTRARPWAPRRVRIGQREGGRLAGAGLGGGDEVAAGQDDGDGPQLDGRGIGVAGGLDAAEHGFGEIESFERHDNGGDLAQRSGISRHQARPQGRPGKIGRPAAETPRVRRKEKGRSPVGAPSLGIENRPQRAEIALSSGARRHDRGRRRRRSRRVTFARRRRQSPDRRRHRRRSHRRGGLPSDELR